MQTNSIAKLKCCKYVLIKGTLSKELFSENDVLFSNDTGKLGKKKFRVLLSGIEPETFRVLVRMLYHSYRRLVGAKAIKLGCFSVISASLRKF